MADQMDGKGRPPKRRSGLTRGQKGLIAAAAVLAVALAGVLAWQSLFVRPDLNTGKTEPQETEEPTDPVEEIDWGEGTRPRSDGERKSQDYYTVLILGRDTGGGGNTDTMLLASYDVTNQKATVMSIPRDTMVNVSWDIKKINSVYNWYGGGDRGIQALYKEISQLVGFEPDYQVVVEWDAVGQIVDAMGGVDYDVDISFTLTGRETVEGYQHMDGQQVLDYCRWRKGGRGDIDRIDRQQRILFAIFEQMLKTDQVKNIPDIYTAVQENIDTNLDTLQIATLAWFAKDLSMDDIARHTVPGNGQYVGSTSYYIVYQNEKNEMVQEIFGVEGPFDEAITLEAIEARVAEQEGTLPGGDEEATPEEITALQLQAQDMLTFMEERADMSSSEVSAAYSALQSAISSGSASALRSAIATAQSLLPGSESSVPALETPAPTADIPQEDGTNIYETFPSEDDSNVYE